MKFAAFILAILLPAAAHAAEGLPWFTSDRFDLYRGGTNDVPWTFQYVGRYIDGDIVWFTFQSPAGTLEISFDRTSELATEVLGSMTWDGSSVMETQYVSYSGGSWFRNLGSGWWGSAPGGFDAEFLDIQTGLQSTETMQIEWIEPSLQRVVDHWYAGVVLGIPIDLFMLLNALLVRPLLRVLGVIAG